MEKMIDELLAEMKAGITGLAPREAAKVAFGIILKLKDYVLAYDFKDDDERIKCYKIYKPLLVAELYYYLKMYRLDSERPEPLRLQRDFLRAKIRIINNWFSEHKSFCRYIRWGETKRDVEYFLPGYADHFTTLF